MKTSESEEDHKAHKSLTHLGRLTQVWVYIGKHPKQINNEIPLWNILMWKRNYLTNKKGVISELVYQLKYQNKIIKFSLNEFLITQDYSNVITNGTLKI